MTIISIRCSFDFSETAEIRRLKKERVRRLVESKAQTLKEASDQGNVTCGDVRSECETLPFKIVTDNDCDITEFARGIHKELSDTLEPDTFSVDVAYSPSPHNKSLDASGGSASRN